MKYDCNENFNSIFLLVIEKSYEINFNRLFYFVIYVKNKKSYLVIWSVYFYLFL